MAAKPDLKWELYNLKEDRTELDDLSERFPEKKEQLIRVYETWAKANGVKPRKPK